MDCCWNKNYKPAGSSLFALCALVLSVVTPMSKAAEPVCAQVKVEIRQELTLERQAFDATMRINNGLDTLAIENVAVTVNFTDENGVPVLASSDPNETNPAAKFFIRVDTMDGINDITGNGSVAPSTSGEIHWLIIPVPGAAEGQPGGKLYYVGAHLSYSIGGVTEEVDVTPDFITVKPMPQLVLDYFLTSEVIADDAFTSEIEPPEPFTLGVRIHNKGTGPANKVAIDSAQPKIVENEQGLLIGFTITGSSLDDQPASPDLKINFGDIAPDASKMGRWIMESTLSGKFTEFTADISHSDELGGVVTSLIDPNDVNTHFLLRDVRVDLPGRDTVRDFLAYPVNGTIDSLTVYESDTADSAVPNLSSSASLTLTSNTGTDSYYTLVVPAQAGPFYVRLADPFNGTKVIKDVVRSDGKVLSPDNAWNSKTRNRNTNPPSWEYWLNLFDANGTGSYVVHIGEADLAQVPPVLQFIDDKVTAEGLQVGFMVVASDPNGDPVTLTATPLPMGAQFVDNGDGTAYFNWTPAVGQAGLYAINFKASDGNLNVSRTVSIKVNPAWDNDGDGMDDAWELDNFGDLSHDGSADSDGDGVSDLDEYLNGTDPNLLPPAVPTDVLIFSGNGQSTITWPAVNGATGYRIYWSDQNGVTKVNGTLLEAVASPYTHTGLVNGTTYYYVMSSIGPGGESNTSVEFSVIPGKFDWDIPGLVEQSVGNVEEMDAAVATDGSAIMVWAQSDGTHTNLWGARNLPGSGWDTPVLIDTTDTADVSLPRLVIDPNGYAMVVWRESDGLTAQLMVADYGPAIGWSTPSVLSSAVTIGDARLVIRNDGSVITAWSQGDTAGMNSTIWSNSYIAGAWGSAQRIESGSAMNTASLQLKADASGNLLAVWSATADGQFYDIVANTYDVGAGWGTEQTLRSGLFGDTTMPVVMPQLAMNSAGQAVLVWNEAASPNSIWANTYESTSGWGTATLLDISDTLGAYMPVVAIDGVGSAFVAWVQSAGATDTLHTSRYVAGGGWDATPAIQSVASRPSHPGNVSSPALAMDNEGNAVLTWQQGDGVETNIWAQRYERSSASWLTPRIIETENNGDAVTPMVVMNPAGDTLVAWRQNDGQDDNLWANGFAPGNDGMPNILPVVVVNDVAADEHSLVTLAINDTFDQDGSIVSYIWGQVSGSSVVLTGADTASASFTAPTLTSPENLVFAVNVTDDLGGSTEKLVTVAVNPVNALPTANAGADQSVDEQTAVSLSGTASDSDGSVVSTVWSQVSGTPVTLNNASTLTAGFSAPTVKQTEILIFRLTVTDDEGGVTNDDINITANPVNHPPVVDAGIDVSIAELTQQTLHAQASDPDADGVIASYQWSQIGGPAVSLNNANSVDADFTAPAVYQDTQLTFQIDVVDDEGGAASDTIVVTVFSTNPDDDADGMDDLWEIQYFGDLSHDGSADTDGDGATDLMEFEFGTDPLVPQGPGEPAIDTPDGSEVTSLQPQLMLSNGAHHPSFVVTYQFEVYSDPAMTQLVTRASAVTEGQGFTTWTVDQPLKDNTWYYWRGRADGWVLFSSWVSSSFFINTINDPPGAFNISSPQDSVWVDTFTPLLSVTNSSDVDGDILTYGFEVFRYGEVGGLPVAVISGISEGTNGTTSWLLDTPLSENEWYTWRGIVTDEHGAQTLSKEASFFVNTYNDAPSSPIPQSPVDSSEITTLDVELVAGNATDPDSTGLTYTFELDTVNTFDSGDHQVISNIPEGNSTTRWYVSGLRDNTWYYWRVKASDGMAESAWSVARFFVNTANDAPTIPVHENPGDGAWVGTLAPTLSVYPSTDVDYDKLNYVFEIYSSDRRKRIDSLVASGRSDSTFWQVTPELSESGWYYWRVMAIDEHGAESGWSDTVIFYADHDGINDAPVIRVKKLQDDERKHRNEERSHRNNQCSKKGEHHYDSRRDGQDACGRRQYTTIRWSDNDPDSNATIRLYVDTDNVGEDGTLIVDGIQEDPDGKRDRYRWDITDLAPGIYFVYAEIDDGTSRSISYSPNALVIGDGGGHPYIELDTDDSGGEYDSRRLTIKWDDLDSDSNAIIALYYADDNQSSGGNLISEGIEEDPDGRKDRYQWDLRSLAAGTYSLYAVISDENEQLTVYAPYKVTIRHRGSHDGRRGSDRGHDDNEKNLWQVILQWVDEHLR